MTATCCVPLCSGWLVRCFGSAAPAPPASAADYPDRPVRCSIGFAAGGPVDTVARIMAQALSDHFGQQFVVENRAGSGGNIATARGDQCAAGRLHAAVHRRQQRDLGLALQAPAVRFHPRHRAGRDAHAAAQHAGGVECDAGQDRSGVHRLLQGQSRQDLLCLLRQRHLGAHVGGIVQGDDQMRHGACALSRLGDGDSRRHLQQGAADLRQSADRAGAGARRQRARARRDLAAALAERAGRAGDRRDRAGLRGGRCSTACPRPRARRRKSSRPSTRRSTKR